MRRTFCLGMACAAFLMLGTPECQAAHPWGLKPGEVTLQSAGPLAFGPDGILFVGDPNAAAVEAIEMADAPADPTAVNLDIPNIEQRLADTLGSSLDQVRISDMAVNPLCGVVYLSVTSGEPAEASLVRVERSGKLNKVELDDVLHARAELVGAPENQAPQGRRGNPRDESITDLAFADGKLFLSGLVSGESSSIVREMAFPFADRESGTRIEIYHAAHGRLEDDAVVRTFAPLVIDGEPMLLAGFTCTPLVKFPLSELSGDKLRGTTVAELGNRNRPLDMIVYKQDGKDYVLMSNSARGVMKISTEKIQDNSGLTAPVGGGGTAGQPFETIAELTGVEQLDRLDDARAIILARSDNTLNLRTIALP